MNTQTVLKALDLDFDNKTPAAQHRRNVVWMQRARHFSQLAFALFILSLSVVHHLATEDGAVPSIDALCPFGGVETLYRYIASGGQFVPKTHLSNLVLLGGLAISVLISGGAFCGWVCPFGSLQDLLTSIRKRLHLPEIIVPEKLDQVLRYGRFVVLGLILYQTIATVKLWFADFDPYRTVFGLDWLFDFDPVLNAVTYGLTLLVLAASFLVERGWCRYACPLGGVISVLGNVSLLRIRRADSHCKGCAICERPCPVKLHMASMDVVNSNCIGCMACVEACPRHGALELQLHPTWWDTLKKAYSKLTKTAA